MDDKVVVVEACDDARKEHFKKAASLYVDAFELAEGDSDADAIRKKAADRFKAGLKATMAAHDSSLAIVEDLFK